MQVVQAAQVDQEGREVHGMLGSIRQRVQVGQAGPGVQGFPGQVVQVDRVVPRAQSCLVDLPVPPQVVLEDPAPTKGMVCVIHTPSQRG